jgi:hypothetical protein
MNQSAGMGIAAVPHATMLFAFADGAGLQQNQPCPTFDRPESGPSFLHHQHRNHSWRHTIRIFGACLPFRAANTGLGFGIVGAPAFPPVPSWKAFRSCNRYRLPDMRRSSTRLRIQGRLRRRHLNFFSELCSADPIVFGDRKTAAFKALGLNGPSGRLPGLRE